MDGVAAPYDNVRFFEVSQKRRLEKTGTGARHLKEKHKKLLIDYLYGLDIADLLYFY